MNLLDAHAHYNDEKFDDNREKIIEEIHNFGVNTIINAGYSLESSKKAVEIAKNYDFMYATVGVSPNDIENLGNDYLDQIEKMAQDQKVVAIGEIGLDYYWNKENKCKQQEVFIKQIELANKLDLPIVIHTREAVMDTINILKGVRINKVCDLIKERDSFIYKNLFEISLDKVKDLGYFVEIEVYDKNIPINEANQLLLNFVKELNLDITRRNLKGYSYLMYDKLNK